MTIRQLWEARHHNTPVEELSWFQTTPATSLELIDQLGIDRHESLIDIGGGISNLAGTLVERGYDDVTVLDVSQEALAQAAARQPATSPINFVRADVLTWEPSRSWRLWHDRAVFHFLTEPDDRAAYLHAMGCAVEPGGAIIIGTFAPNGPDHCSGLPVQRYDAAALLDVLTSQIALGPVTSRNDCHITPNGVEQAFTWIACRRRT